MVRTQRSRVVLDTLNVGQQFPRNEEVIQPGAFILLAAFRPWSPPGIGSFLLRVKCPEYVNITSREKCFKTRSFLRLKQGLLRRILLILRVNVDILPCHIEVTTHDNGL